MYLSGTFHNHDGCITSILCRFMSILSRSKNKSNIRNAFRETTTFAEHNEELMTKNREGQNSHTDAMKNLMHSFNHAANNSESIQEQEGT